MRLKRKRHPITLLEIMIVILLIGVIGGVLSYNLKGTLDRGKKFRTDEGIKRLKEILDLELEKGYITAVKLKGSADSSKVIECIRNSGFIPASNLNDFIRDGWKEPYIIMENGGELFITSQRLDQYNRNHK